MPGKLAINGGPKTVPDGVATRWPIITEDDKQAVMGVLDRGILYGVYAPEIVGLEEEFADFVGAKHGMATGSGTSAIHCALFAAGVEPGDEVITSAFSFSGSFHPILQQNAIPVFVDIDPRTYNIDVAQIEDKITDKTKVLLPVHIHGLPVNMDEIMAIAAKYDLTVVEDAAQAHGAEYRGRRVGTFGAGGAFSLNATKNLAGGEGGLMVTDDEEFLDRARQLRTFGEDPNARQEFAFRPYHVFTPGHQYRYQELAAAFARSQLKRLEAVNRNAQENCAYFGEQLEEIPEVVPPHVPPDRTSVYHKYRIRFRPDVLGLEIPVTEFRRLMFEALEAEGVSVAVWHLDSLAANPIFQEKKGWGKGCPWSCHFYGREITYDREDYPETMKLLNESIIIGGEEYPLFTQKRELLAYYVEAIRKVFDNLDEIVG